MRFSAFAPRSPEKSRKGKVGSVFKSAVFIFSTVFLLLLFIPRVSFAQSTSSAEQNLETPRQALSPNTNPDVPINLHTWTQSVMLSVMSAMSCQLAGIDPLNPSGKCLGIDPKTGKIGYVNGGGAINGLGKMIGYLYTPPLHTGDYVSYLSQNFGLAKPTYAQGLGFSQLSPLIKLWGVFRNISYLLFVLIFVVVGIAIMLRVRIDPRTVMTIQNQIPKLVIGLVMITLSYAIAGFMVDLMWVSTYLSVNIIGTAATPSFNSSALADKINEAPVVFANDFLNTGDPFGGLHDVSSQVSNAVNDSVSKMFGSNYIPNVIEEARENCDTAGGPIVFGWITCQINNTMGNIGDFLSGVVGFFAGFVGGLVAGVISGIIGFVAFLIIIIALLYALFRLWFQLIKAYIFILVDVVFAPLWILGGLLPGASALGFGPWLRDLLGNLAAFPAVIAMFALARVFMDAYKTGATGASGGFIPPLIGNFQGANIIPAIIAFGIILATPEVVNTVKKAFKAPGLGIGGGAGLMTGATGAMLIGGIARRRFWRNAQGQPQLMYHGAQTALQGGGGLAKGAGKLIAATPPYKIVARTPVGKATGFAARGTVKVAKKVGGWFKPPPEQPKTGAPKPPEEGTS